MLQRDYIMRLIAQVGDLMRKIAAAKKAGREDESQEAAAAALALIFDLDPRLSDLMPAPSLLALLREEGRLDTARALLAGEVYAQRARHLYAAGAGAAAEETWQRAVCFFSAVEAEGDPTERAAAHEASRRGLAPEAL